MNNISRFTFLIVLTAIIFSCNKNPSGFRTATMSSADDSLLSDSLKTIIWEDAARLALRYFRETDTTWIHTPEIPEHTANVFYNGLVHIHNAANIAARDSVADIFPIHTFPNPVLNRLVVMVDTTADWIDQWIQGESHTCNTGINELMTAYKFNIERCSSFFDQYYMCILRTDHLLNIEAIARLFENIDGVRYAAPDSYAGGGNDISGFINTDHIQYEYYLRWGDCPSGCIHEHAWFFNVHFNGEVEFLYSEGDPVKEYRKW